MNHSIKSRSEISFGYQIIADFFNCDIEIIDNKDLINKALIAAVKAGNATLIKTFIYRFLPNGLTGLALLSESHISIHTWPKFNYAAIDIFMCGNSDPHRALKSLEANFKPHQKKIMNLIHDIPEINQHDNLYFRT